MSAAELLEQAHAEGVLLVLADGRLTWKADHQPPIELLTEIKEHRLEIIEALSAVNDPQQQAMEWLARLAALLYCSPGYLLARSFIDQHDLEEQLDADPVAVARLIRSNPAWMPQGEHLEQPQQDGQRQPQHVHHTAATASPEWVAARDAYINHLMACRACYAPSGHYCVTGAELRAQYDATPWSAP